MACKNCAKIRSAVLQGKMAEAAGLTVDALREKFGLGPTESLSVGLVVGEQAPEEFTPETKGSKSK